MDFNKSSFIELVSGYPELLTFENRYLHGCPFTMVVEDSSFASWCFSHFMANFTLLLFMYTFVSYCLRFSVAEMLSNIFIYNNLKMDEHLSHLYICFNTLAMAVRGPARWTFMVYWNQEYADMIYQYGRANKSSRRAAACYHDAYPNYQNYPTYNTIQNIGD